MGRREALTIPPGSMGRPILGETIAFHRLHLCTSLGEYMEEHMQKYGKIYMSTLFRAPTIVLADAELNQFVPKSVLEIFGKTSMLIAEAPA